MSRDHGPSLGDADLWSLTTACDLRDEGKIDEELVTFHTPFDECMVMAEGNKETARAMYWGQFRTRHWRSRPNFDTEV
jgi:hypothetical protein